MASDLAYTPGVVPDLDPFFSRIVSTLNDIQEGGGIADDSVGVEQIDPAIAGRGLKGGDDTALAVEPADFAGDGLEDDGADNLQIVEDGVQLRELDQNINPTWTSQHVFDNALRLNDNQRVKYGTDNDYSMRFDPGEGQEGALVFQDDQHADVELKFFIGGGVEFNKQEMDITLSQGGPFFKISDRSSDDELRHGINNSGEFTISAYDASTDTGVEHWRVVPAEAFIRNGTDIQFDGITGTPKFSTHDHSEGGLTAIPNAGLTNSSLTVTAGTALTGGGSVALGASTTLNVDETAIQHDNLSGYVAAEHIDWTTDQGATNIDPENFPHDHTEAALSTVPNAGLTNDSVTVAGNAVSLGGSTGIAHSDLTGISSDDHHTKYTDEEAQDAVGTILTDTSSISFTYDDATPQITATVLEAGVDHDSLSGFVANEHVDHSTVSISGGDGISGGGDITASRTLAVDLVTSGGLQITTGQLEVDEANVAHDSLSGFVANEHVDHSGVSISSGTGLSGGGDITASRTLSLDAAINDLNDVNASPSDGQHLEWDSGTSTWIAGNAGSGSPGGTDGEIQYNNGGSFGGASTLHWDDGNSRLGIGTSSPSMPLDVAGQVRINQDGSNDRSHELQLDEGDQQWWVRSNEGDFSIRDHTGSSNRVFALEAGAPANSLRVASSGNVGIGTSSPAWALHVRRNTEGNTVRIENESHGESVGISLRARSSGGAGRTGGVGFDADANFTFMGNGGLDPDNLEKIGIGPNGNVGIGTTSPGSPLHVENSGGNLVTLFKAGTDSVSTVRVANDAQEWGFRVEPDDTLSIRDQTAGSVRVKIDGSGNVGIGTASPQNQLHVAGGDDIRLGATNGGYVIIESFSGGAGAGQLRMDLWDENNEGSPLYKFSIEGSEIVRFSNNGNVGIGTTSPNAPLEVRGGAILAQGNVGGTGPTSDGAVRNIVHHGTGSASSVGVEGTLHTERL